jgi:hypothetical protein
MNPETFEKAMVAAQFLPVVMFVGFVAVAVACAALMCGRSR